MLLEQIQRRLAAYEAALPQKKVRAMPSSAKGEAPAPGTVKTIGIKVDAETYEALDRLRKESQLGSMKEAALEAIKRGLKAR